MVINKNQQLLKEIQNIINTNNINMNVADMLMNVFSYTDIIDPSEVNQYIKEGWNENEAILNILYDYLGLDKDNKENQEIMGKYVLNNLKHLNPNDYLNNPYVKAIKDAGYVPGKDFMLAMDAAASEWKDEEKGVGYYYLPKQKKHMTEIL